MTAQMHVMFGRTVPQNERFVVQNRCQQASPSPVSSAFAKLEKAQQEVGGNEGMRIFTYDPSAPCALYNLRLTPMVVANHTLQCNGYGPRGGVIIWWKRLVTASTP